VGAQLTLRDIRHVRAGREVLRVDRLDVPPGERLSVLGSNGAGKTTMLRLLAAVDRPTEGEVTVGEMSTRNGGVALRRHVAYATQRPGLLSTTVLRNVEMPLRWRKVPRERRRALAMAALDRLQVAHLADRPARALSGGEQQRVSLARALALDPEVLLLDEPAAGLDVQSRATFFADLDRALEDRAATVVHVSHRPQEALRLADRVVVLVGGLVRQVGTPEALNRSPVDVSVAALVGYDNVLETVVESDGRVCVEGVPTGLSSTGPSGAATVAVFADGVRVSAVGAHGEAGLRARVARVAPGPGHRVLSLAGGVPLVAHVPLGQPTPGVGADVQVSFDPALTAVLPRAGEPARTDRPAPSSSTSGPGGR
jgi:ABC-type sulfate/molybdate transport systems ATPase subunit